MVELLPMRVTPELEYLQGKWAAHLPFAAATALLKEILPIAEAISVSGMKRRVRAVGAAREQAQDASLLGVPGGRAAASGAEEPPAPPTSVAVDSAWLKHCDPPRRQARHVNLVAGRVCFRDGRSRLYAYVHNQVASAAGRLDRFLSSSGVGEKERVTILSDGAGEFEKAVQRRLIDRIVAFAPHTAAPAPKPSLLDRVADRVAEATRSWCFVAGFALAIAAWLLANSSLMRSHGFAFDPYPYDLLKLVLTMIASVQGPIILISQQHTAAVDRAAAEYDAAVAVHSKLEILRLHKRMDRIERGLISHARVNADPQPPSMER